MWLVTPAPAEGCPAEHPETVAEEAPDGTRGCLNACTECPVARQACYRMLHPTDEAMRTCFRSCLACAEACHDGVAGFREFHQSPGQNGGR